MLHQFFNRGQLLLFFRRNQRNGNPFGAGAASTANPVHIIFRRIRQVVIHHKWQLIDIQTSRSNIGCHQDIQFAFLEFGQRGDPLLLRLFAMNRIGGKTVTNQITREFFRAVTRVAEYDHLRDFLLAHQLRQYCAFTPQLHRMHALLNLLRGLVLARHFDQQRRFLELISQLLDFRGERCGKQQGLTVCRQQGENAANIGQKAHIQHAVCLVHHQYFHARQVNRFLLHVIQQAPRRCHQNFDTSA